MMITCAFCWKTQHCGSFLSKHGCQKIRYISNSFRQIPLVVELTCLFDFDRVNWNCLYFQLELEAFFTAASGEGCDNNSLPFTFQSELLSLPLFVKKVSFTSAAASERPWRLDVKTVAVGGIVASNSFPRELAVEPRTSNGQHTDKLQGWQKSESFPKGRQMQSGQLRMKYW